MKINLRQARKLEAKINKELSLQNYERSGQIDITKDFSINGEIEAGNKKVQSYLLSVKALRNLRFLIRKQIGSANAQFGVNDTLTEIEAVKSELTFTQSFISGAMYNPNKVDFNEIIEERQDLIKKEETLLNKMLENAELPIDRSSGFSGRNVSPTSFLTSNRISKNVEVAFLSEVDIEEKKDEVKDLTKKISTLEDKLLELNFTSKIQLSPEAIELVKKHKLI